MDVHVASPLLSLPIRSLNVEQSFQEHKSHLLSSNHFSCLDVSARMLSIMPRQNYRFQTRTPLIISSLIGESRGVRKQQVLLCSTLLRDNRGKAEALLPRFSVLPWVTKWDARIHSRGSFTLTFLFFFSLERSLKKRALQRNSFTAQCHFHSKYLCICELCFTKRKIFQILPNTYSLENKASCSGRALHRATQASGCRAALLKRTSLFSYSTVSQVLHQ